ncbi:MAG: M48 family metallopeptidase [Spongiibacteraceae bacterium]|nr:M48 family metallopeptidase [Spongiibacteraceae bacterium]
MKLTITVCLCLAVNSPLYAVSSLGQTNEEIELPVLGNSSSGLFSLQQEYQLGRAWLSAFRSQVKTVSDPLLQVYLEDLIYKLATHSELKDHRLDIVVVENPSINAFAVPGGVVGVHNGLLLHAETEAQLASVLSHELAHLSQRHFARSVETQQRNAIPNMAGLLAGIILAATQGGDAGLAAIMASRAANLQSQLRYSRLHEQEADRKGMQTMVRADFDPNAGAAMFEKMQQASRFAGNRPPEFLLSHPVTESRISDNRNRARQHQRKIYTDNLEYQLMRARVELHFSDNNKDAINRFRAKIKRTSHYPEADQYGLVLALINNRELNEASQRLKPLRAAAPNSIPYIIAEAQLLIADKKYEKAISLLTNMLSITPNNHPLTMTLAQTLLKANEPHSAEAILKKHSLHKPTDPSVWYLLAETHGLAGNIVGVHQARAEYFVLNGVLDKAEKQLGYALPLVKQDHLTTARIKERILQIKQLKEALEKL